jgi:hypothetical protein
MEAQRHEIIHEIVTRSDLCEHLVHSLLLARLLDWLKSEIHFGGGVLCNHAGGHYLMVLTKAMPRDGRIRLSFSNS